MCVGGSLTRVGPNSIWHSCWLKLPEEQMVINSPFFCLSSLSVFARLTLHLKYGTLNWTRSRIIWTANFFPLVVKINVCIEIEASDGQTGVTDQSHKDGWRLPIGFLLSSLSQYTTRNQTSDRTQGSIHKERRKRNIVKFIYTDFLKTLIRHLFFLLNTTRRNRKEPPLRVWRRYRTLFSNLATRKPVPANERETTKTRQRRKGSTDWWLQNRAKD